MKYWEVSRMICYKCAHIGFGDTFIDIGSDDLNCPQCRSRNVGPTTMQPFQVRDTFRGEAGKKVTYGFNFKRSQ